MLVALALLAGAAGGASTNFPGTIWSARGPGGGGALYAPTISPYDSRVVYVGSDMDDSFRSDDRGRSWNVLNFITQLHGYKYTSGVQFTGDSNVMYCASGPGKTVNGGRTWMSLPNAGGSTALFADGNGTNRLVTADYSHVYYSGDGGASASQIYTGTDANAGINVGGAYFDGPRIFIGTSSGLLVSVNNGTNFAMSGIGGIPGNEHIVTLAGATAGSTTRLFCATFDTIWGGMSGWDCGYYQNAYRLDYVAGTGTWGRVTNGINRAGGDQLVYAVMATNDIRTVYLGGSEGGNTPLVMLSTNGGNAWSSVFRTTHNANIATGWEGDDFSGAWNWRDWGWDQYVLGLGVCPNDSRYAAITGLGFMHITTNTGASWNPAYVVPADQNPTNTPTLRDKSYQGNGIEDTSCWSLLWASSNILVACFTDIHGMLSTNGGVSWLSPSNLTYNSTYHAVRNPVNGQIYVAASSAHDIYVNYISDGHIDNATGEAMYSADNGLHWQRLHNFTKPTIGLGLDPANANRLFAAVVNYAAGLGGIYVTSNLNLGAGSTWTKLANPPRTEGHALDIVALNDGSLVCTYAARIDANYAFTASSGVFASTNGGASWLDRSDTNMTYFTTHLTVDPHDPGQNTWYAGVFETLYWQDPRAGLYRTTNRGLSWTRLTASDVFATESCTVDPADSNTVYVATHANGLWYCTNVFAAAPLFLQATNYPFTFPTRVYFNPYDAGEMWTTSFGNGMRVGRPGVGQPLLCSLTVTPMGTGSGAVVLNPPGGAYTAGTAVVLSAVPDPGSTFAGWSGAVSGAANPTSLILLADASVTAAFTQTNPPVITSPLAATGTVGTTFLYAITADHNPTGFTASGLPAGLSLNAARGTISGTPAAGGTTGVTIAATNAYGADVRRLTLVVGCVVDATAGANGSIAPAGAVPVAGGASQTFAIAPAAWFGIADVQVDGVSVGAVSSHTFAAVMTNHAITATFTALLAPQGTPQWWLAQYGWTNGFAAAEQADADGDGVANWIEYQAGTDPTNPLSRPDYNIVPYAESFENLAGWGGAYGAVFGHMGWYNDGPAYDGSRIANEIYALAAATPPLPNATHTNVLRLDVQSGVLSNSFGAGFDMTGAVTYVDLAMQFAVTRERPEAYGAADTGIKAGVYVDANTNLVVYHGVAASDGAWITNAVDVTARRLDTNGWYRLTIAVDASPTGGASRVVLFQVRIDGTAVASAAAYPDGWKAQLNATGLLPPTSPGGTWFRAATTGTDARRLRALCFQGAGGADDVVVTTADPLAAVRRGMVLMLR